MKNKGGVKISKSSELTKNTIIILIGTICTKLITFLLLPLYTGILNTDEFGLYDLLITIVSLLIPIVTFQLEQAVFRELIDCRNEKKQQSIIISSAFFTIFIQCIVTLIVCGIVFKFIDNTYKYYLFPVLFTSIISSLLLQIARGFGNNKLFSKASFVNAFVTVLINIVSLTIFKMRVEGLLLGQIIGQVVCIAYLCFSLKIFSYFDRKNIIMTSVKKMLCYSFPLIPNALSWWIFSSSDRIIVSAVLGLSFNGILAAATKISSVFTVLYGVFDRSWIESIALHINDDDIEEYFNKMFNEILKIFISLAIFTISIMPFIYDKLVDAKYSEGYYLVPILLIAAVFNVIQGLIVSVYAAKKNTKSIAKTSLAAAIFNIVIHIGLIKFVGIYAAVLSTLGSYFIIAIYRYWDVRKKYLKIEFNKKMVLYSIVVMIIVLTLYYINFLMLNILSFIISLLIVFVYNKNSIKVLKNFLTNKRGKKNEKIY